MLEAKMEVVIKQHIDLISQVKQITGLQSDIAIQVMQQHEELDSILKGLGLKKDLSYYSFNLHKERGH